MNRRGFTLIELLIVIAIIGILSAIAVSGYVGVVKKAARSEAYANLESLRLLEEQRFAETAAYAPSAAGVPAIQAVGVLPGFRPGPTTNYNYAIVQDFQLNNTGGNTTGAPPGSVALIPCFVATARGVVGTRVCPDAANCDMFAIDCNNNRNF
jgi:prepilin-type N-terminal cleavage/methylation domain-containing protein